MELFAKWLPYILAGVSVGGQYALIAIGYTMVYGILRLINFAHGDMFMMAGLIMIYLVSALPIWLSVIVVIVFTVILGCMIEEVAYRPLRSAPRMSIMISAIGVSYFLQNIALYVTGGLTKTYPSIPFLQKTVTVLGAHTKMVTVITPILTIALVFALVMLINHTKIGMAMRAVSRDFETSELMGIDINQGHHRDLHHWLVPRGGRLCPVLFELHRRQSDVRLHAGSQGIRRGGIRRHRLRSGRSRRRVCHRYLRKHHEGRGTDDVLRCIYVRIADCHSDGEADRYLRRKKHQQGIGRGRNGTDIIEKNKNCLQYHRNRGVSDFSISWRFLHHANI